MFGFFKRRKSAAEVIEERLMREWIVEDADAMNAELGADDEARKLVIQYGLSVAYNSHASEPRWEVSCGRHRTFFNEYTKAQSLGDAVRECIIVLLNAK